MENETCASQYTACHPYNALLSFLSFETLVLLWIRRPPRPIANASKDWLVN